MTLLFLLACLPELKDATDTGSTTPVAEVDEDGDGFDSTEDCDDQDPSVHPGADEPCDGADNDCDGDIDEEGLTVFYADEDGDGYGSQPSEPTCGAPEGHVVADGDCDDANAEANPGLSETCSTAFDDDCDGDINEDEAVDAIDWYPDSDEDGFGAGDPTRRCEAPEGSVDNDQDCDDEDPLTSPEAEERCNGLDDDCDGAVPADETDDDGDGYVECTGEDCDDANLLTHVGADELCNTGEDEDCDSSIDEDDAVDVSAWYADSDGDGDGDPSTELWSCEAPSGYVANDLDCEDQDDTVYDGASELCDGQDNDCDGSLDATEGDDDGDGYVECTIDSGGWDGTSITGGEDCDDGRALTNPGATEYCNSEDDDCDGTVDEDDALDATTWYVDGDGDGFGDASSTTLVACDQPSGYASDATDCDDSDGDSYPGAPEVCEDGVVNDCNASSTLECGPLGTWTFDDAPYAFFGRDAGDLAGSKVRGGDVDEDGQQDLIVVAPYANSGLAGGAWIFLGPVTSGDLDDADMAFESEVLANTIHYTTNALLAGDLTGNGSADFLLAAESQGAVYLFEGPLTGGTVSNATLTLDMAAFWKDFGDELITADVDDDGVLDLVVSAPDYNSKNANGEGAIYVLHGPVTTSVTTLTATATFDRSIIRGSSHNADLGSALTHADYDGDGSDELIVGAPSHSTGVCEVGSLEALPVKTAKKLVDAAAWYLSDTGSLCGSALDSGDQNGDGYPDLAFSALGGDGTLYLFNGPLSGSTLSDADATLAGPAGGNLGNAVALAGDLDDDGYDDLVGGDYRDSSDRGTAWVWLGPLSGSTDTSTADAAWTGDSDYDYATYDQALSYVGDATGNGYDDLMVGAPWVDDQGSSSGAAWLLEGGPGQ